MTSTEAATLVGVRSSNSQTVREAIVRDVTLALAQRQKNVLDALPRAELPPQWHLARRVAV